MYTIRTTDSALLKFDGATWSETGATVPPDFKEHGLVSENAELFLWGWRAGGMQMFRWDGAAFALAASLPGAPRPCGAPTALNGMLVWPASTRRPAPNTCVVWDGTTLKSGAVPLRTAPPVPESATANFVFHPVGTTPRFSPLGGAQYSDGSIVFWGQLGPVDIALAQGQLLAGGAVEAFRFGLLNPADGAAVLAARRALDNVVVCSFEHRGQALTLGLDWTLRDLDGTAVWSCPADARAVTVGRRVSDHVVDWLGATPLDRPDVRIIGVDATGLVVAADATGAVVELPDSFTLLTGLGGDLGARPVTEAAVRPSMLFTVPTTGETQVILGGAHRHSDVLDAAASTPTYRLVEAASGWTVHPIELAHGRPDHAAVETARDVGANRLHVKALNRATRLWHHYVVEASGAVLDMPVIYSQGQEPRLSLGGTVAHHEAGTVADVTVVGWQATQLTVSIHLRGPAGTINTTVKLLSEGQVAGAVEVQLVCSPAGTTTVVALAHLLPPGAKYHLSVTGVRS